MMGGAQPDVVLRTRGLRLGYADAIVLAGVDLRIGSGEFWFLLGPNGSGKTTLLKALLGLLEPLGGAIERHPELARRERLGFVPQHCELSKSMPTTVREFVALGFVGSGVERGERAERLAWALERTGLAQMRTRNYWSLSGGQRRRTHVARALVRRPALMILDEPTEGLDAAAEHAFLTTLCDLNRDGMTLLFVTHKLELAPRHATHVALFGDRSVRGGPAPELLRSEEIERAFGVPAVAEPT